MTRNGLQMPLVYDWKILWNQCGFLSVPALEHTLDKDNVALKNKLIQMLIDLEVMRKVHPHVGGQWNSLQDAQFLEQAEQGRLSSQKMTFPRESLEKDFTYKLYKSGQAGRLKHNCLQTNK
ncbi:hypothetical protein CBL_05612 [Carabus blaptoides fortunei]